MLERVRAGIYCFCVKACRLYLLVLLVCAPCLTGWARNAEIKKVLPHLVDKEGRHTLSPSLYERDAYQEKLRLEPDLRHGLRFDVHWKARGYSQLTLRMEMRGTLENQPTTARLERPVKATRLFSRWSVLRLDGENYQKFGDLVAWRATLWEGDTLVAEHKSFLW